MFRLLARKPLATISNDNTSTAITTAAYVQLSSKLKVNCAAIQVFNGSSKTIKLAVGSAGNEVDLPFNFGPGVSEIIPFESQIKAGVRLSARAVFADASTGDFTVNLLGG